MPAAFCHSKVRYATREFAEEIASEQRERRGHHAVKAATHRAYYCVRCGCWHTGHSPSRFWREGNDPTMDAIGRLRHIRETLIVSFGKTKNQQDWTGVRVLTRTIRHLQGVHTL